MFVSLSDNAALILSSAGTASTLTLLAGHWSNVEAAISAADMNCVSSSYPTQLIERSTSASFASLTTTAPVVESKYTVNFPASSLRILICD